MLILQTSIEEKSNRIMWVCDNSGKHKWTLLTEALKKLLKQLGSDPALDDNR